MSLKMRGACEGACEGACGRCKTDLTPGGPAFACSFGCTFCEGCTNEMGRTRPNCGGELMARPKRDVG